jgi:hypothetical protein
LDSRADDMADENLTTEQATLYDKMVAQLKNWGLVTSTDDSLAKLIWRLTKQDKSGDFMLSEIRASDAYAQRFPVLAELNKKYQFGWDEAKYIAQEESYTEALASLGPAADRYKTRDTFAKWMMNDVAPVEVQRRVDSATTYIYLDAPASVKTALRSQYGLSDQEMISYMLDPKAVGKELELKFAQSQRRANIIGAASDAGVAGLSDSTLADISESRYGQSYGDAALQFSNIAAEGESWNKLSAISGEARLSVDDLAADEFGTARAGQTAQTKKRLASQERARFQGSSAIGNTSLRVSGLGTQ